MPLSVGSANAFSTLAMIWAVLVRLDPVAFSWLARWSRNTSCRRSMLMICTPPPTSLIDREWIAGVAGALTEAVFTR